MTNSHILIYQTDGTYLGQFGSAGSDPDQFGRPHGLTVDNDGHVYVSDYLRNRILKFRPVGITGSYADVIVQ
jgi:glucose/arabinose dehydrogenase